VNGLKIKEEGVCVYLFSETVAEHSVEVSQFLVCLSFLILVLLYQHSEIIFGVLQLLAQFVDLYVFLFPHRLNTFYQTFDFICFDVYSLSQILVRMPQLGNQIVFRIHLLPFHILFFLYFGHLKFDKLQHIVLILHLVAKRGQLLSKVVRFLSQIFIFIFQFLSPCALFICLRLLAFSLFVLLRELVVVEVAILLFRLLKLADFFLFVRQDFFQLPNV